MPHGLTPHENSLQRVAQLRLQDRDKYQLAFTMYGHAFGLNDARYTINAIRSGAANPFALYLAVTP